MSTATFYASLYQTTPSAAYHVTWDDLVEILRADISQERDRKEQIPLWAPHELSQPARANANVSAITFAAIDVDGASWDEVAANLTSAAVMHGSPSDDTSRPDARRFRVVAPLSHDVPPADCARLRCAFAESLGLSPDAGVGEALDPARAFFVGRVTGSPRRKFLHRLGPVLDVDALLRMPLRHAWPVEKRAKKPAKKAQIDRVEAVAELVSDEYEKGRRHELLRALAGYLARRGWSDDDIEQLAATLPSDQVPARIRVALDTAAHARAGRETPGWLALWERLGDTATRLERVAKDPREPAMFGGVWSDWWARAYAPGGLAERMHAHARLRVETSEEVDQGDSWAAPPVPDLALDVSRQGVPRATHSNVLRVIDHILRGRLWFDSLKGVSTVEGVPRELCWLPDGQWTDAHTTSLVVLCEDMQLRVGPRMVADSVERYARERSRNPLQEHLFDLARAWDGKSRVDKAMATYWGATDDTASAAVSRVFLLSLAARGMDPGCKMDTCPVLIGGQGQFKSQSLAVLAGDPTFMGEGALPIGDKDAIQTIRRKWIWELAESIALSQRDRNVVKAFLSTRTDTFRASYGRHAEDVPRTCVLVASANDDEVLTDPTGARRFLPVHVGFADLEALRADRDQLLGEAAMRVLDGEEWWPSNEETKALLPSRDAASAGQLDCWVDLIGEWADTQEHREFATIAVFDELQGAIPMPRSRVTLADQRRAGSALRKLGYTRCMVTVGRNVRAHGWRAPPSQRPNE